MEHKNDYAQSGGSRNYFLAAGRRFGCGRAGLIFLSLPAHRLSSAATAGGPLQRLVRLFLYSFVP